MSDRKTPLVPPRRAGAWVGSAWPKVAAEMRETEENAMKMMENLIKHKGVSINGGTQNGW